MRRGKAGARWVAVAVGLALMATPVGGVALATHGTRTLGLRDDTRNTPIGKNRPIKAVLSTAPDSGTSVNIDFEITGPSDPEAGPGHPNGVNSPQDPDLTCTIESGLVDDPATSETDESRTCTVGYKGDTPGTDLTRGWIDHDGSDATTEADMGEGHRPDDDDNTDVVETLWFEGVAGTPSLDCGPEVVKAAVHGTRAVVECWLTSGGVGVAGALIDGENLGGANETGHAATVPADYDDVCTTDADGRCAIAIPDHMSAEVGRANVCFWADEDSDSGYHASAPFDGSDCNESVQDGTANLNTADVVRLEWRHGRWFAWNAVTPPVYGRRFSLSGRLSSPEAGCRSGIAVTITRTLSDGTRQVVGSATTDANGAFVLSRMRARRSARYTASVEESMTCNSEVSRSKTVMVRKWVGLKLGRARVARGELVRLRALVAPCGARAGERVVLLASTNNGRTFRRIAAASTNGACVAVFRVRVRGTTLFRAVSPKQDPDYLGGASALRRVRVA
jgi:hypothetical protein